MAKRNYSWTEEKIAKYIKEGRGSGELGNYKPWLTIHEVPSKGNSTRIKGWKTERVHHLFSNIEKSYFYLLDWSESVLDIREQFPLDRLDTIEIANEKGIKHIKDEKTDTYIPMTTDFLVTLRRKNKIVVAARSVKPFGQLEDERTLEKLEVERDYWEKKGIEWTIVTDKDIPKNLSKNIQWIHPFKNLETHEDEDSALKLGSYIVHHKQKSTISVYDVINYFEEDYLLNPGVAVNYFRYMLANKYITVDMDTKINLRSISIQELSCMNLEGVKNGTTRTIS